MSVREKLTAIADAIRNRTGETSLMSLDAMAQGVDAVFDEGQTAGKEGFWDDLQNEGKRTDYRYAFFNTGFTSVDPKWPIKVLNADSFMAGANRLVTVNWDKFDLSEVSSLYNAFGFCYLLQEVDTDLNVTATGATLMNSIFRNCYALQRVKKLTAFPAAVWKQSFEGCGELTHIIFDGTIGSSGLDLHWSTKLDRESIESIINALSPDTTGLSVTLSYDAVAQWWGSGDAYNDISADFYALCDTKPNWTITLL